MKKTTTTAAVGGGVGAGALVVWLWGIAFPEIVMPAEVAAIVGSTLMGLTEALRRKFC